MKGNCSCCPPDSACPQTSTFIQTESFCWCLTSCVASSALQLPSVSSHLSSGWFLSVMVSFLLRSMALTSAAHRSLLSPWVLPPVAMGIQQAEGCRLMPGVSPGINRLCNMTQSSSVYRDRHLCKVKLEVIKTCKEEPCAVCHNSKDFKSMILSINLSGCPRGTASCWPL